MRVLIHTALAVVLVLASGCSPSGPSGPTGSLSITIKDSPGNAKALLVTFDKVTAHHAEGEWETLSFAGGAPLFTCDLIRLQNVVDVLGAGTLLAGQYTQLRFVVKEATLYFDNPTDPVANPNACAATMTAPAGKNSILEIPSGEVKLNRQFTVPAAGATEILIDFDADRSVVEMGNGRFRMTPVIGVVSVK